MEFRQFLLVECEFPMLYQSHDMILPSVESSHLSLRARRRSF